MYMFTSMQFVQFDVMHQIVLFWDTIIVWNLDSLTCHLQIKILVLDNGIVPSELKVDIIEVDKVDISTLYFCFNN